MNELITLLITTATGLLILGCAYLLDVIVGVINVLFSKTIKWSWKKLGEDFIKALLIAGCIEGWVILWYITGWYSSHIGLDITEFTNAMSISGMIGSIGIGAVWYLTSAGKNLLEFVNTKHIDVKIYESKIEYKAISDKIKRHAETITSKTIKEELKDEGEKLDGKEIKETEAGMGGLVNTYPEPYRSAKKDSMLDPSTCYNRECVSYCAWKICEVTGKWPPRTGSMNAKEWIYRLPSWGYNKVDLPQNTGKYVGVSTKGQYGHVVWFEFDNTISEYNYSSVGNYDIRAIDLNQYIWYEIKAPVTPTPTPTPTKKVTYTYKSGDTFGQVICDLGLKTSHGLWGKDGDVNYYTEQLHQQGIYGNIPVGTTITLTPRKD